MRMCDKSCPKLRLDEFDSFYIQICRVVEGDRYRTAWFVAIVAVLGVPTNISPPSLQVTGASPNHCVKIADDRIKPACMM